MNSSSTGTRPFKSFLNFRSDEASASIPAGSPVLFSIDGTEDGFAAHLPSSSSAAKCPELFAGVFSGPGSLLAGYPGAAQIWGLCDYAIVVQQSRAASTDSYATAAALSVGQALSIDTVNNAFATGSQFTGARTIVTAFTSGTAATDIQAATLAANFGDGSAPMFVMAQTLASAASSASTSSDSSTKKTYGTKIFLRAM